MGNMSLIIRDKLSFSEWIRHDPLAPIRYLIRWIRDYFRDRTLVKTAQVFAKALAEAERVPIGTSSLNITIEQATEFLPKLAKSSREMVLGVRRQLDRQLLAYKYRKGELKPIAEFSVPLYRRLVVYASNYKATTKFFAKKALTPEEEQKLKEAACYREFADYLMADSEWRDEFFRWTIVNDTPYEPFKGNPVEVFVKFPSLYIDILRDLSGRFSRFGGDRVRVHPEQQVVEIPIEGRFVQVLKGGPKLVLSGLRGNGKRTMTIEQIFSELQKKITIGYADIEMLNREGGFYLHNASETGPYHEDEKQYKRTDLTKKDFVNQFPIMETLTAAEVEGRYGLKVNIDFSQIPGYESQQWIGCPPGKYPIVIIKATQTDDKQMRGTHTFFELLMPNEQGQYDVRSCGEYVEPFPQSIVEMTTWTVRYHHSIYHDNDETKYSAGRMHAARVLPISTPVQWEALLDEFRLKFERSRTRKNGFHTMIDNCTGHIYQTCKRIYGKATIGKWHISYWDLNPSGVEGKLYNWMKGRYLRTRIAKIAFFLLGSWRSIAIQTHSGKEKSVSLHSFWNDKGNAYFEKKKLTHPSVFF